MGVVKTEVLPWTAQWSRRMLVFKRIKGSDLLKSNNIDLNQVIEIKGPED